MEELKKIEKALIEIEDKIGITAYDIVKNYMYTLYRKIEDTMNSRENWKIKYNEQKEKVHALENHIEMLEAGK